MDSVQISFQRMDEIGVEGTIFSHLFTYSLFLNTGPQPRIKSLFIRTLPWSKSPPPSYSETVLSGMINFARLRRTMFRYGQPNVITYPLRV